MTTFPIIALADGEVADPQWFEDVSDALNDHETRIGTLEQATPPYAYKTLDESVSSATTGSTLQNDDELLTPVAANSVYEFELWIIYNSSAAANFKAKFTVPSLATMSYSVQEGAPGTLSVVLQGPYTESTTMSIVGKGADALLLIKGSINTLGSGTLQFQWAQNSANAALTYVKKSSWLKLTKIL